MKATLDSECQLILVLTETDHTVLLIDKYWLQAAILVTSFSETTVRQLQREKSDETLVSASFLGADSLMQKGLAHAKSAVTVSTGMKRHGRSFNDNLHDNPKCAEREREAGACERPCKSGGAPSWVEPVASPVLSRSCFGVDAQQLVAVDLDSVRGVLSAKVPDSSFAEARSVLLSEPTHMEDEDEDHENEKEDERDCEECKVESRRESRRTIT